MDRAAAEKFLTALLNSALAADAMMPCNFRKVDDLTPEERERSELGGTFRGPATPRQQDSRIGKPVHGKVGSSRWRTWICSMRMVL